jgi:hypothetical protein
MQIELMGDRVLRRLLAALRRDHCAARRAKANPSR